MTVSRTLTQQGSNNSSFYGWHQVIYAPKDVHKQVCQETISLLIKLSDNIVWTYYASVGTLEKQCPWFNALFSRQSLLKTASHVWKSHSKSLYVAFSFWWLVNSWWRKNNPRNVTHPENSLVCKKRLKNCKWVHQAYIFIHLIFRPLYLTPCRYKRKSRFVSSS